jgi:glyoxylase-like metal-dependent hydrolase (beta-lactamase superfamily II)
MRPLPAVANVKPEVTAFYDPATFSLQYIAADPVTRRCAIIDPVLDFDAKSGGTRTASADQMLAHIAARGLTLDWILDTHPHADHFSAAGYLKDVTGAPTATGAHIVEVQKIWKRLYNLPDSFRTDGSQWDHLFADGENFQIGGMNACVLLTPGHTLCSVSYLAGDAAFVNDTLFMPDSGTARTDFPGGDAARLWHSIQRILSLPDATRLFTGHDYCPHGRPVQWESSVAAQKASNAHVCGQDEARFVALRTARDAMLPMPKLILSALLVNISGGRLPAPESNGRRYLKIPLDAFPGVPWD